MVIELGHAEVFVADPDSVVQYIDRFSRESEVARDEADSLKILDDLIFEAAA